MDFKTYLRSSEKEDVIKTIKKLPKKHRELLKDLHLDIEKGLTLKGDNQNVGSIEPDKKKITICGPWNFGREFTFLHEIGHEVWDKILDKKMASNWFKLCPKETKEDAQEIFCMFYANFFCNHRLTTYQDAKKENFIKSLR